MWIRIRPLQFIQTQLSERIRQVAVNRSEKR